MPRHDDDQRPPERQPLTEGERDFVRHLVRFVLEKRRREQRERERATEAA